jgi:pyruvate/2-oxoglutarate dehydrogenase complex dihydrolipoamide acyltransferase (E2) component
VCTFERFNAPLNRAGAAGRLFGTLLLRVVVSGYLTPTVSCSLHPADSERETLHSNMVPKPPAAAEEAQVQAEEQAAPADDSTKHRGTKRQQDQSDDQQPAAASKKPRAGAAAAASEDADHKAGSSKDTRRTRGAGQADSKPEESRRQTRQRDAAAAGSKGAAPAAAGTSKGAAAAAGTSSKGGAPEGKDLVGCRIKVWWTDDKKFYPGVVTVSKRGCGRKAASRALVMELGAARPPSCRAVVARAWPSMLAQPAGQLHASADVCKLPLVSTRKSTSTNLAPH